MTTTTIVEPLQPERAITMLVKTAAQVEKLRVSTGLRISAVERGASMPDVAVPPVYIEIHDTMRQLEDRIDSYLREELEHYPVYTNWLCHVRGIGPGLAAQLLGLLRPPLPGTNASTWYKAAGLVPEKRDEGTDKETMRLPRPRSGEGKVEYYPYLRRCLYNVWESFMRQGGYYKAIYDTARARLDALHPDDALWPKIRLHRVANWIMVKRFLSDMYSEWSKTLGFEVSRPYVIDLLRHQSYQPPPQWDGGPKI